jgi:tetratricopeptide (TPR) repeat protein
MVKLAPKSSRPEIVVTEFYTQGQLKADGSNLAVYHGSRLVPWRMLQVGPGDYCRVAFRTVRAASTYKIYYGGPAPAKKSPPWTDSPGLLLETRRWRACNAHSLPSVRQALAASVRIGSDYVPKVWHAFNPFSPGPHPFLSVYRGTLKVSTAGTYRFFTSSQDFSFLLIDGKQVVAAPGFHGPVGDARIKGEVTLTEGKHGFEYYHGAAGGAACMAAAWQSPDMSAPEVIPPSAFAADMVAHLPAGRAWHRVQGAVPEYTVEVLGEVPLVDSNEPLLRVQFTLARTSRVGKIRWDFGDGQTRDLHNPVHVYLHPGLYTVKISVTSGMTTQTAINRVFMHRAVVLPGAKNSPDRLAEYLQIFQRYNSTKLAPRALLQVVRAYDQLGQRAKAVRLGKNGLLSDRMLQDEKGCLALVKLVGPWLRDRQGDAASARAAWAAAARAMRQRGPKAECELEAADITLNDLNLPREARALLDSATGRLESVANPPLESRLYRIWGDWHARNGDKKAARTAYARAAAFLASSPATAAQQNALRGALSRSTEAFLREKQFERALAELRRWQDLFPRDKIAGYLPLLQARYWAARGRFQRAIVLADDLAAVNPDSPYADRLIYLAAECAEKLGRSPRARAGYQTLVTDHPGSPLVPAAKEKLARLRSKEVTSDR